jgi:endonuclease YncB( thermonuclease family)
MTRLSKNALKQFVFGLWLVAVIALVSLALPRPDSWRADEARAPKTPLSYSARVIKVSDGDTIIVRFNDENIKIRLAEIDAPENGQAWGTRSRHLLVGLVAGKHVIVLPTSTDRYGRTIAHIELDGQDINRIMVLSGAAWAYPDYVRDPQIIQLQDQARAAQSGLWAMPEGQRQPPWDYRAARRDAADVVVGR